MRLLIGCATALILGTGAAMAGQYGHYGHDGPRVYAVHTKHNYCPAGLQPVTIDGVICCGSPNQSISYHQMKAHAVAKKRHVRAARVACPVGVKGCN